MIPSLHYIISSNPHCQLPVVIYDLCHSRKRPAQSYFYIQVETYEHLKLVEKVPRNSLSQHNLLHKGHFTYVKASTVRGLPGMSDQQIVVAKILKSK